MPKSKIEIKNLNVSYGAVHAVKNISIKIEENTITAFIGASGCGKSSFLRCFNRMNDELNGCSVNGELLIEGTNVNNLSIPVEVLRLRVGMVFQKANPFPKSIYDNIAYGLRIHQMAKNTKEMDALIQESLEQVGLWSEVKDRLHSKATELSGGQQQRLCIARAIAIKPEIILMDEPCSALDPIATETVERLIVELGKNFTIIIVTHSMSQARRISDKTAFFHMGELIEFNSTKELFFKPKEKKTNDYLSGTFG